MKIKLLLVGRAQDKQLFKQGLNANLYRGHTYFLEGNEIQLHTTTEQVLPAAFTTQSLDGYHGVIYLHNPKDDKTAQIINQIPPSLLKTFDTTQFPAPVDYLRTHVAEFEATSPFVYREPASDFNFVRQLYQRVTLFFTPTVSATEMTTLPKPDDTSHHTVGRPTSSL